MTIKSVAKGYAVVFGSMHVAAFLLGMQVLGIPVAVSDLLLLLFAALCYLALVHNTALLLTLTGGWSVAVMVEWMHLIAWSPPASDLQYVVFALLNMGMALSAAILYFEF